MHSSILALALVAFSMTFLHSGPDGRGSVSGGAVSGPHKPEKPGSPARDAGSPLFGTVLLPTDFSDLSEAIVGSLSSIPGLRTLVLVHFLKNNQGPARQQAERLIAAQKEEATRPDIDVVTRIDEAPGGNIPEAILASGRATHADLIVVGARTGILSGSLLGRGATMVLTRSRRHVLIMRQGQPTRFGLKKTGAGAGILSKIIFPTDFSKPAHDAMDLVKRINGVSEVVLLHVIRKTESDPGAQERTVREVEERLRRIREELETAGISATTRIRYGNPDRQICAAADEEHATMILMSRYGRMDYLMQVPVGTTTRNVAQTAKKPVLVIFSEIHLKVHVRELDTDEFFFAEKIWLDYHANKSDPENDRIFCVFVEETPVSVARCKRHPDGLEVDGVFTWEEFRGKGYGRRAMEALVAAYGNETLYMHATLPLVKFYGSLGFVPVLEKELPPTIRARYAWAMGEMTGANVCPMKRAPTG
jgi:nucleotide-binding universal stress UspA family protein/GNAT superfamily N-acetyltransferase